MNQEKPENKLSRKRTRNPKNKESRNQDEKEPGKCWYVISQVKDDILTDLEVAYVALFEEANSEYIAEREKSCGDQTPDKIPIPSRVYSSFLNSIENDVLEYVSYVVCLF